MNKFNTTFRLGLQRSSTDKMSLYKCKCGGCNKGWWSSCANSFLSHSLTAGCFFPHCLGLQAVPSSYVWCLGCSAPLFQVSPSPPLAPLSLSLCRPPPAHTGADNKRVRRDISAAAKPQRGARSCERSTHAEVTQSVVTMQVAS